MKTLPYIDRLAQAQWFERFGFVAFAAVGCLGIVIGKLLSLPAIAVTTAAVVVMLLYALIMWRSIAGRVRADQAGDNLYYLGLLYTLTGLAYAIFTFRPENSSNSIVEGFGIALATTIIGLMLRVFFNQIRLDLVETEERARMDLAQAASELKAELNQIVVEMNDFGRQTRQSLAEAVSGVEEGMIRSVKEAGSGLAKLSTKAEEKVTAAFSRLENCADELIGGTQEAVSAITENASALKKAGPSIDVASKKLNGLADAAEQSSELARAIADQAERSRAVQEATTATSSQLQAQVEKISHLLTDMRANLERNLAAQDDRLRALEKAPTLAAEQVSQMLQDLQARFNSDLTSNATANSKLIEGQVGAMRNAISTLEKYNAELSAELEKANSYTNKVLGSLVTVVDAAGVQLANGGARPQ